ncbi:Hypothetical predicted protein [Lecanosticta acicola]|uniref:Uncharacterized protein n=1 Tax=Lecanosticta acicola TaxID=111012 RepID=A0AAI8W1I1_9PEZI|nr:Hypothetical predicted protein [Lecanosticta acicola]
MSNPDPDQDTIEAVRTSRLVASKRRSAFPSAATPRNPGEAQGVKMVVFRIRHFNQRNDEPWLTATFTSTANVRSTIQGLIEQVSTKPNSALYLNSDYNNPGKQVTLDELVDLVTKESVLVGGEVDDVEVVVGEPRRSALVQTTPPRREERRERKKEDTKCCVVL